MNTENTTIHYANKKYDSKKGINCQTTKKNVKTGSSLMQIYAEQKHTFNTSPNNVCKCKSKCRKIFMPLRVLWISADFLISSKQLVSRMHTLNKCEISVAEVINCHAMEKNVCNDNNVLTQCKEGIHCNHTQIT